MTARCCAPGAPGGCSGGWLPAPSTLGTFLRAFTFGHVRQLDALLGQALERAWQAGAGPGDGRLVVDVDSFVGEVCGRLKEGAAYGYSLPTPSPARVGVRDGAPVDRQLQLRAGPDERRISETGHLGSRQPAARTAPTRLPLRRFALLASGVGAV